MFERVVIVTKRSILDELVLRFQTREQARFYLTAGGEDFDAIERDHFRYQSCLSELRQAIPATCKSAVIERAMLPQYRFLPNDLVVTLGPDGLVVNTAKYLDGQPIVPLNPDPERIDGILCPIPAPAARAVLERTLSGKPRLARVTMAEAKLADGQSLLAVNDLFIGARSHVSARYRIAQGERSEMHSSSGIIISTGAGSTGWMRSVFTGASAVAEMSGAGSFQLPPPMPWDSERLLYSVREPFPSKATQTTLVCGTIDATNPLEVVSHMPGYGVIFSDGVEADSLNFNSGATAQIQPAARKTTLSI